MARALLVLLLALPVAGDTRVTLLHISDYHSHALPFFTEEGERGGIARAIGYLQREKRSGALVFSGGDTINKGAPAWSDRYGCAEWRWLNGVVDAMAFGNHDADYGAAVFERCKASVRYPILSANTAGFRRYAIFESRRILIGVFAVAGSDFSRLVPGDAFSFGDPVEAACEVVRELRERQRVDAVVMIGHQHAEADYALAREVGGIDLIFGSHSHLRRELTRIDGTDTWFISGGQYLTDISRVELMFRERRLVEVSGSLEPVDRRMPAQRTIARHVRQMQRRLEQDPQYRHLFVPVAHLPEPLFVRPLAMMTLERMRKSAGADVALSTISSFRRPLAAGALTLEDLRAAMPYDNELVSCTMTGADVRRLLEESAARAGSDSESYVLIPDVLDPAVDYVVATTDYQARIAYRDLFRCELRTSGLRVREELRKELADRFPPR